MSAPSLRTLQKKLGPALEAGESFVAAVEVESEKSYGAALAMIPGGVVVHAVQQTRRRRALAKEQTVAARVSMDARLLALTDRRLAIIKWDVFRPKLESWIAVHESGDVTVERKRIETGAVVVDFVDGSRLHREATRRTQLTAFAAALAERLVAPGHPTTAAVPGAAPIGLYGWTMPERR